MTQAPDAESETYKPPERGWTCFHCGETFTHENLARAHFGHSIDAMPGCVMRMQPGENALLRRIRSLEDEVKQLRHTISEEDSETSRATYSMRAEHSVALIREEEKGYAAGLNDARKELALAQSRRT